MRYACRSVYRAVIPDSARSGNEDTMIAMSELERWGMPAQPVTILYIIGDFGVK